jgi:replicative DNA helicase
VAVFSLEMSRKQLTVRLACSRAHMDATALKNGYMTERDFPNLTKAIGAFQNSKLLIDDHAGITIQQLRAKARRFKQRHQIELVVIDYLQLIKATGECHHSAGLDRL